jgi:hypothetical protein
MVADHHPLSTDRFLRPTSQTGKLCCPGAVAAEGGGGLAVLLGRLETEPVS